MKNFKILMFTLLVMIGQGELFAQKNVRNFTRKSAQLTDSIPVLNAKKDWLITVASLDSLIGGSSNGSANSIQLSDGIGGFSAYDTLIINEGDTINLYFGLGRSSDLSFEFGVNNLAAGIGSVAFGSNCKSYGDASFSLGYENISLGNFSFTAGGGNNSTGNNSSTFGAGNISSADYSSTFGVENWCRTKNGFFIGAFAEISQNDSSVSSSTDTIFSVGNGNDNLNRSNALTLRRDGALSNTGAFGSTARETYVGSSDDTIANNVRYYRYNPASIVTSATIYLPPNPFDGQELIITGGGTITSGNVISTMTIAPNAGQSVLVNTHVLKVDAPITMYWDADDNLWITISN